MRGPTFSRLPKPQPCSKWTQLLPSVAVLWCGCSSNDGQTPAQFDSKVTDGPVLPLGEAGAFRDSIVVESGAACAPFQKAGQSCENGQVCPIGLAGAKLGTAPCQCYVSCNPAQGKTCAPKDCGYLCVQLTDQGGQPMPNMGACVTDPGKPEGEPCPPQCKTDLLCTTQTSAAAFCRKSCDGVGICAGYKMVCGELLQPKVKVCLPGGATTGPKEGESCAADNVYCQAELICAPDSKLCVRPCDPQKANSCGTDGKSCVKLVDSAAQVTVGYGCR